ncbi:MAG: preprotein translocase subunit SecG [Xanthomonadales bacterium]|nr:preprotein translocase subunit SecG [Xanthomonadales bacterium]
MQVLNIFHVLIAIAMVAFVLVQRGPGATAGAAFGAGASGTVFGSRGAGSFLTRTTWVLAALFCLISLGMAVIVSRSAEPTADLGVVSGAPTEQVEPAPEQLAPLTNPAPATDLPEPSVLGSEELDASAIGDDSIEDAAATDVPPLENGAADDGSDDG